MVFTLLKLLKNFKPLGFPLGVKTRADKLSFFKIDWRRKINIGIGLFFKFNIIANKKYCFTIIGSLKVESKVIYKYTAFGSACSITEM